MSDVMLRCTNLTKFFAGISVVNQVSFSVETGDILTLLGPSGCGKTTILRMIAGFEQVDAGQIEIAQTIVADERRHLPPEKRRVGLVFQDYAIFPHLTVGDNVAFGLGRGQQKQVEHLLDVVGLPGLSDRMPHELSGGQQQRVALARALAPEPAILLFDEPFSNLDASLRVQVRHEVRQLLKRRGTTAIFVTHDQEEAMELGDTIGVMSKGHLEQVGSPEMVFHQPKTQFVAEFMGETDFLAGRLSPIGVETVLGVLPQQVDVSHTGNSVKIAVRPDDVVLTPAQNGHGNAVIHSRRFIGIATIYRVRLADGSVVASLQPHILDFAEGDKVQATFRPGHQLPIFQNGKAI